MALSPALPLVETDLYGPIRDYLVANGYAVQAEVKHCDVTARKGDDLIIVEMKLRCSLDLLIQATKRQRITDSVYVAIAKPAGWGSNRRFLGVKRVLRQLELGLILVSFGGPGPTVEIEFHPLPYRRQKRKSARRAVIKEMEQRSGDYNVGGGSRRKQMTAWREVAVHIACCLERFGTLAPRQLRALGTGPKTQSVLGSELSYGWFTRVAPGLYDITAKAKAELADWPEVATYYRGWLRGEIEGEIGGRSGTAGDRGQLPHSGNTI